MRILTACVVLAVSLAVPASALAQAGEPLPPLERALLLRAGELIKLFGKRSYDNVGVLKFRVGYEDDPAQKLSDRFGTANLLLARRLQIGLELTNSKKHPIGIIEDASTVAAKQARGANHFSTKEEARARLFTPRYPLAWGDQQVAAKAFVSGEAFISKNHDSMKLRLYVLDGTSHKMEPVLDEFRVALSAGSLAEIGDCFIYRGTFTGDLKKPRPKDEPPDTKKETKQETTPAQSGQGVIPPGIAEAQNARNHLAKRKDVPVRLKVFYGETEQQYVIKDAGGGQYRAYLDKEPAPGQAVALVLERENQSKDTYAVVLQVNGENTVGKEHMQANACRPWLLKPGTGPAMIPGYYMGKTDKDFLAFKGLTGQEEQQQFGDSFDYGEDIGTITMTVFPPAPAYEDSDSLRDKEKVLSKAAGAPAPKASSYNDLFAKRMQQAAAPARGLIGSGENLDIKVAQEEFQWASTPVMVLTIVYARREGDRK
jgi:hypothetical protein